MSSVASAPPRGARAVLLAVGVLVASGVGAAIWVHFFAKGLLEDAWVYLGAGRVFAHGGALYSAELATPIPGFHLGFTYPPISAALFSLAAGLPIRVGAGVLTGLSIAALFLVCLLAVGAVPGVRAAEAVVRYPVPLVAVGATWLACTLEPVRQTFSFGQVNLVLLGLVAADCLVAKPWWPRGALIGIAAAIKLTPIAFLLFFLARGRIRPAVVAVATFVVVGALAWVLSPADSVTYWLHDVLDTDRIGSLWYAGNQSLRGAIARLGLPATEASVVWALLALLLAALTVLAVRRRERVGDLLGAAVVVGAFALLVSPVSWTHHWVWTVPGLIWAAGRVGRARSTVGALLLILVAAVFVLGPQWLLPTGGDAELHWTPLQFVVGDAYVVVGVVFVAAAALWPGIGRRGVAAG